MTISTVAIAKAETDIGAHQAALELAEAQLASAQWNLDRTVVHAPNNGAITNLTLRKGDMATINVADRRHRRSRCLAHHGQLQAVLYPRLQGRRHRLGLARQRAVALPQGQITGIARGFSRNPGVDKLLPYVAPTTDWIRLQRRIPVTIVLEDLPPGFKLYMGADAAPSSSREPRFGDRALRPGGRRGFPRGRPPSSIGR